MSETLRGRPVRHLGNSTSLLYERIPLDLRFVGTVVTFMVIVFASAAAAQSKNDRDNLRMLGACVNCDFSEIDLEGRKLIALDVRDSSFTDVSFQKADMNLAIFDGAKLSNVSFAAADLAGASFSGATLTNVSFVGAKMTAAVFEDAILIDTDLQAGDLCNTQMPDQTMDNSDCN